MSTVTFRRRGEGTASADWHTYGVSLRLLQPKPEPG